MSAYYIIDILLISNEAQNYNSGKWGDKNTKVGLSY